MRKELFNELICPVCRSKNLSLIVSKKRKGEIGEGYVKCNSCDKKYKITDGVPIMIGDKRNYERVMYSSFQYNSNRCGDGFKEKTKQFFETKTSPRYGKDSFITKEIAAFVNKHSKDSVFLDFGGGDGQATEHLKFRTIFHIDNARKAYHDNAVSIIADGENLPLKDKSIDCGIAINVFHHIDGWRGIREISRILKPRGRFLFIDKTGDNPIANTCYRIFKYIPKRIKVSIENEDLTADGEPIKIRMFKHTSMENACRKYGLKPTRVERTKMLAWFANYLDRFLPTSIKPITNKLEPILMKTPAKSFCFETIMEVEKTRERW